MQFTLHQQAGDLPWPPGMVDECDMEVDIEIAAEVQCTLMFLFVSAQWSVAESVRPKTLQYLTDFHQTFIKDALWYRDERITFWVKS